MDDTEAKKEIGEYLAEQENSLVTAHYKMTPTEKHLLNIAMSKVNPEALKKSKHGLAPTISVSLDEWRQVFPSDSNPWQSMSRAADRLLSRSWRRDEEWGYRRGNWFSICDYNTTKHSVALKFTDESAFWLYDFHDRYIATKNATIGSLKTFNAIRLYELCYRFSPQSKGSSVYRVTLEDLRTTMHLERSYPLWNDFHRKVLIPSIQSINEKTDIFVELRKTYKKGRHVHSIEFLVLEKKQQELDL